MDARLLSQALKLQILTKFVEITFKIKVHGSYFVHSTGHGLGIDVHELPNVSSHSDYILEEGMIITVEPGIYILRL